MADNTIKQAVSAARARQKLSGKIRVPGDKSISHRAMILGGVAQGETTVTGLLEGDDVIATKSAMQAMGAQIEKLSDGTYRLIGTGPCGLKSPAAPLDFGNAGTGARLVMGLVAGAGIEAEFIGDASLSARPMGRVMQPLAQMGGQFRATDDERLPLTVLPAEIFPADITTQVASAQVKSALLLAALHCAGTSIIRETKLTRDHSENMLALFGAHIERSQEDGLHIVKIHNPNGPTRLVGTHIDVPGDPSSAAFPMVAALIVPGSDIVLENVMLNRQRDGLIRVLREMGGQIDMRNRRHAAGEEVADLHIRHSQLRAMNVDADIASDMIDEYPALAIAAASADGTTKMHGLGELRVKESDRLAAIHDGLAANGVAVESGADWLHVTGCNVAAGGNVAGGGKVITHHDHRIAMAFLCLGLIAQAPVEIDDRAMIATSFPNFFELMAALGADFGAA